MQDAKLIVPFLLLLAMWLLFMAIVRTKPAHNATGRPHRDAKFAAIDKESGKSAMNQGGDGVARHKNLLVVGCLFSVVTVLILVGMLVLGFTSKEINPSLIAAFAIGAVLYEGAFVMLFLAYGGSLVGEPTFIGPFPAGTSWVLFGVYLAPYYFIVLYVVFFDRWFMTPESIRQFELLVEKYQPKKDADNVSEDK